MTGMTESEYFEIASTLREMYQDRSMWYVDACAFAYMVAIRKGDAQMADEFMWAIRAEGIPEEWRPLVGAKPKFYKGDNYRSAKSLAAYAFNKKLTFWERLKYQRRVVNQILKHSVVTFEGGVATELMMFCGIMKGLPVPYVVKSLKWVNWIMDEEFYADL